MRRAKRSLGNKSVPRGCPACHAVDLGDLQRFLAVHGREKARDAFGEHCFSAARGTHEKNLVVSRDRNFQSSFRSLLATDLGKIRCVLQRGPVFVRKVAEGFDRFFP